MPPTCVHLSSLLVISIETGEELKMKNEAGYLMSTSIKCLLGLFRDKYKELLGLVESACFSLMVSACRHQAGVLSGSASIRLLACLSRKVGEG